MKFKGCSGGWIQRRYVVAVLAFWSTAITYGQRSAVAVTMAGIMKVREPNINITAQEEVCPGTDDTKLDWSTDVVGWVFSGYGLGYIITQLPGGVLAVWFPAYKVFGLAMLMTVGMFASLPLLIPIHYGFLIGIRILQGLVEGTMLASLQGVWSVWAPEKEKNVICLFAMSATALGPAIGMLATGYINCHLGWEASFFIYSGVGLLVCILWFSCVFESPLSNPERLGKGEIILFAYEDLDSTKSSKVKMDNIPWKDILTSLPVHCLFVAYFVRSWVVRLITSYEPSYLHMYGHSIDRVGLMSAFPLFVTTITIISGGFLADFVLGKNYISRTIARKLFFCIGFGVESLILFSLGFVRDESLAVACLTMASAFSGIAPSGYQANSLDLARDYASVLMGISKIGTIGGSIMPLVVAQLTKIETLDGWSHVFWVSASIEMAGVLFFGMFASGEQQPWSNYNFRPCDSTEMSHTFKHVRATSTSRVETTTSETEASNSEVENK